MKKRNWMYWLMIALMALALPACNQDQNNDTNTTETNTTDEAPEMNGPVHASDFVMTMDINDTRISINWEKPLRRIRKITVPLSLPSKPRGSGEYLRSTVIL